MQFVGGDRTTTDGYAGLDGDFDAVVDVARDPAHVRTALAVLRDRVAHYRFVSSINVYADAGPAAIGADESAALLAPWTGEVYQPEDYGAAKVTCENLVREAFPKAHLVTRAGLIAGPGDASDRTGYWPLRFAAPSRPDGAVLVPHQPDGQVQLIDARDLANFLVSDATGTFNTTGPAVPLHAALAGARAVAGHTGDLVPVTGQWLSDHGVQPWSGDRSLPLWLPWPDLAGMMTVSTAAATRAGLRIRPLPETFTDGLAWELQAGPGRPRRAGLSPADEADLITARRSER
ncbi:SDR family oxidoreductase [Calidifontibacter terrae]